MLTFRRNTFAALALLSLSAGATDYTVEYGQGLPPAPISGRLNDDLLLGDVDPIFHRASTEGLPGGHCLEGQEAGNFRYDTITLTNTRSTQIDLDLEVVAGSYCGAHNAIVYGYSPSFFPDDPNTNCLVFNDDWYGSCRLPTAIAPNQTAVFVVTSYWPDEAWSWTATFNDHLLDSGFEYELSR